MTVKCVLLSNNFDEVKLDREHLPNDYYDDSTNEEWENGTDKASLFHKQNAKNIALYLDRYIPGGTFDVLFFAVAEELGIPKDQWYKFSHAAGRAMGKMHKGM